MPSEWLLLCAAAFAADPVEEPEEAVEVDPAVVEAFHQVAEVLRHPRCANCHPVGDVPLRFDSMSPHAMGVTRASAEAGLPCSTCHRETGFPDDLMAPPANPHWSLPPANQVFEDRTDAQLCAQLNDPETTGGRDLQTLLHHVTEDSLVLWGWDAGLIRPPPPIDHPTFVAAFTTWVEAGGPCAETEAAEEAEAVE